MSRTFIIAEAGVNHNGSIGLAKQLIDVASDAGADAVKFQTFKAEKLVSVHAPKAEYQKQTTNASESQFDMLKRLELTIDDHKELVQYCKEKNILFLSTPFDLDSLELLSETLQLPIIKIPSGEITNAPFLLEVARRKKPIILSTGMSTLGEIEQALAVLAFGYLQMKSPSIDRFYEAYYSTDGQQLLKENVTLLHCTTEYPTPYDDVNLKAMDTLCTSFQLNVGLSDHTKGIAIPIAAVARGANVIEKHFTIDRTLPGPDHKASLQPDELKQMVQSIRQVEQALGSAMKYPSPSEMKNKTIARKSLVACQPIQKGEVFTPKNVEVKRPGSGLSPFKYWKILNQKANKDYKKDEVIE